MAQPFRKWTVLPHGELTSLDDRLLTVVGDLPMPLVKFPRRMTVVRLRNARLVIFSAVALAEAEMEKLEAFGKPGFLVVPSDLHRLDARIWKERYPSMRVVAPEGARAKVEEVVEVETSHPDFDDPGVRFVPVPGTEAREGALVVKTSSGTTLVVNDMIWNVGHLPGFGGWLFRVFGLTGPEPLIASVVRRKKLKDMPAFRVQLEAWSRIEDLNRILVSHGEVIHRDPRAALRGLAKSLVS